MYKGYLIITISALLCSSVYFLMMKIKMYKIKKHISYILEIEKIKIKELQIERELLLLKMTGELDCFPYIEDYLSQSTYLINYEDSSLKNLELCYLSDDKKYLDGLIKEIKNASNNILNITFKQADTLNDICKAKYPFKYYIMAAKKNIEMRFLRILADLLIKFLNRRENACNLEKSKELEVEIENCGKICTGEPALST